MSLQTQQYPVPNPTRKAVETDHDGLAQAARAIRNTYHANRSSKLLRIEPLEKHSTSLVDSSSQRALSRRLAKGSLILLIYQTTPTRRREKNWAQKKKINKNLDKTSLKLPDDSS